MTGLLTDAALDALVTPEPDRDTWVIECRPIRDGPPMAQRMKAVLKRMLRDYGVKVVLVRNPDPTETARSDE